MIWAILIGLVTIFAGLTVAFEALKGSKHMRTYDPARGWQESEGLPAAQFWGEVEPPVEPRNTWSNLAYYVAGWVPLLIVGIGPEDGPPLVFGFAMTWLCVSSSLFHGTLAAWAQRWDWSGMLTVFPVLAIFAAASNRPWVAGLMAVAGVAGAALGTKWFPTKAPGHGSNMMNLAIGMFLVFAALPAFARGSWIMALASVGIFAACAYLSLKLDKERSPFMGRWKHAVWHVGTAAALSLMFLAQG